MTAPARTRSRSRVQTRRPAHRASGGPSPRVVVLGTVTVIALIIGLIFGAFAFRQSAPKAVTGVAAALGAPASEVALPSENNPGPVRMNGLVPSGFTTGTTGAVAAAAAYSKAVTVLTAQDGGVVRNAVSSMASSPQNVDAVVAATNGLRTTLNVQRSTVLRPTPLGRRFGAGNTPTRQTVEIWMTTMSATPGGITTNGAVVPVPTEAAFFTVSTVVVRSGGDWKLESVRITEGPTPALGTNAPTEVEQFAKDLNGFTPYNYLPPTEGAK